MDLLVIIPLAVLAIIVLSLILGSFFTVRTAEVVVLTRFGKFLRVADARPRRDDGADLGAGDRADVVDREHVRRVGHRDDEAVVVPADRQRLVPAGQRRRDHPCRGGVDRVLVQVYVLEADLCGQGGHQVGLGDDPLFDEDATERLPRPLVLEERGVELLPGEQATRHEERTELIGVRHACLCYRLARRRD